MRVQKPTRVLHLISSNFVGGPERQILHHARSVASPEFEIWIGSFRDGRDHPEILERATQFRLPVVELSFELSSFRFDPFSLTQLASKLWGRDFALLCTHGYKSNVIGYVLSALTGCPQIGFVRGWIAENDRVKQYERMERWVLSRSEWVVCVSDLQAQQLRDRRGPRRPPVVIPNAALFTRPENPASDQREIRARLGLDEDAFWVGAAGRLSIEKGHRCLIDAFARTRIEVPHARLLILGEGKERANLENQARTLRIADRVYFAGFQRQVQPWMQALDLFVNPSLTEGLPNVLLEAMALGVPVVATAVGGVPKLLAHGRAGILVAPGDSSCLASALTALARAPQRVLQLVQNAYRSLEDYSPEKHNRLLLDLYSKVLARAQGMRSNERTPAPRAAEALIRQVAAPTQREAGYLATSEGRRK